MYIYTLHKSLCSNVLSYFHLYKILSVLKSCSNTQDYQRRTWERLESLSDMADGNSWPVTFLRQRSTVIEIHFLTHWWIVVSQDHRAEWRPVSTHVQALPDPHQQDGGGGDPDRDHHSRSHGAVHHAGLWRPWWEVRGSFFGRACQSSIF